jgi:hypothetical protein
MSALKKVRMNSTLLTKFLDTIGSTPVLSQLPSEAAANSTIGTHDGSFHCDEALAISMLKCLPQFENATVVRTRKPDVLAACHMVVDVGAVYDEAALRFDHHQREFTGVLDGYQTKLSRYVEVLFKSANMWHGLFGMADSLTSLYLLLCH